MKPEIITHSGKMFDFVNPHPDQICIEDIAHALSNICRFTGHTKFFYSVAQHSIFTSYIVPKPHKLAALLHDAAEAYINDIAKPLKQILPDYAAIEERVERVIFAKFGVPYPLPDCVKRADLVMLATEQRDVLANGGEPWLADVEPDKYIINEWSNSFSHRTFINRYHELKREIQA